MKASHYAATFLVVTLTLVLNILSFTRTEWFIATKQAAGSKLVFHYGLTQRCSQVHISTPTGIEYNDYQCRPFPDREDDQCDDNRYFCTMWKSAAYVNIFGIVFASAALASLMVGVLTQSLRRRTWKLVAGLVLLHGICQVFTFGVLTDLWRTTNSSPLNYAKLGDSYTMNTVSWILAIVAAFTVTATGIAAEQGHAWAAGGYSYSAII